MSLDPRLTLARARERLGGRVAGSHGRAGEIVRVGETLGVILFSDAASCDVWLGEGKTQRVAFDSIARVDDATMTPVAEDARAFARLEEGASVTFDGDDAGRLIEKCRFGGLVARADGRIFAVGFRRFVKTAS